MKQIIVSTYQAASGAGQAAIDELKKESQDYLDGKDMQADAHILPTKGDKKHYPLAFNLLPQIDVLEDSGYSHEEWKMIHETKKIMLNDMNAKDIKVTATCVRVPVPISHGESVYFTVKMRLQRHKILKMQLLPFQVMFWKMILNIKFIRNQLMQQVSEKLLLAVFALIMKIRVPSTCGL